MSSQALAITSFCEAYLPLSRASTIRSIASENDSLDAVAVMNPHNHIIETSAQPDFHIFTSLLWARRSSDALDSTYPSEEHARVATLDITKPDLGLFKYHLDRLIATAEALQWRHIYALEEPNNGLEVIRTNINLYLRCLPALPKNRVERRKLRIMINKIGVIRIESTLLDCLLAKDYVREAGHFVPTSLHFDSRGKVTFQLNGDPCVDDKFSHVYVDIRSSRPCLFTTHKTSHRVAYDSARARAKITTSAPTDKEVLLHNKNGEIMEASLCTVYFLRDGTWITPAAICGGNLGVTRRLALERGLCKQGLIEISELQDGEKIWLSNGARGFFPGQIVLRRQSV